MVRIVSLLGAAGLLLLGCKSTFECTDDSQCNANGDGKEGTCQPATGFCSFPDDDCDSGQRYGALAPDGLAGACVPEGTASTGGPTLTTGNNDTTPSQSTGSSGAVVADASSGSTFSASASSGELDTSGNSSDSDGSSDSGSSGGIVSACCVPGCDGTCPRAATCGPVVVGGPVAAAEAIGVAIVGDAVIWSTGFGRTLEMYAMQTGTWSQLATVDDSDFITKIAGGDNHVYFLDHGGDTVKRASVPGGVVEIVTTVNGAQAGFGSIALNDTHAYFAMATSGDVWRTALAPGGDAELVALVDVPLHVAVDDTHLYFVERAGIDEIRRIALDEIGADLFGGVVVTHPSLGAFAIDGEWIYYQYADRLARALKAEFDDSEVLVNGVGSIWEINIDEQHVYFTSETDDTLARWDKDSEELEELAETDTPWGLAVGCDRVYWAQSGTEELISLQK
ncbi:MAG: DUF5050 domain-containing protein [Nannocystaceae bacterium]|nr:DUF5050 domain-containing protein [Nannocystaceae bacterium]